MQNGTKTKSLSSTLREQLKDDPEFKRTGGIFTPYILYRHFKHKLPPEFSHIPKSGPSTFLRTGGTNPRSIHLPGIGKQLHPSRDDIAILKTDIDIPPLKRAGLIFGIQYGNDSKERSIIELADSCLDKSHGLNMDILRKTISNSDVVNTAIFFNVFEPAAIYLYQGTIPMKTLFSTYYHCLAFVSNPKRSLCDTAKKCHWKISNHRSDHLYRFTITDVIEQQTVRLIAHSSS